MRFERNDHCDTAMDAIDMALVVVLKSVCKDTCIELDVMIDLRGTT